MRVPRFGILGYTVLWYLSFMFGGTMWAIITTYLIAYPIACGVQNWIDRVRPKVFS